MVFINAIMEWYHPFVKCHFQGRESTDPGLRQALDDAEHSGVASEAEVEAAFRAFRDL
jgi:hypothetical protein